MMATMDKQQLAPALDGMPAAAGDEVGAVVVVRKSGRDGGRFPLARGTATIGRLESCDIRIALPYVSRKHAELRVEDGKVRGRVCGPGWAMGGGGRVGAAGHIHTWARARASEGSKDDGLID